MTFHTNCLLVQNHWVLGYKIDGFIKIYDAIKYVVLLSFTWFDKILHTYKWKKILQIVVLNIILQKSELIHIILYLWKKYWLYYCCVNGGISKNEAINLMQNTDLTEKKAKHYKTKHLLSYIKIGKKI